MAMSDAGRDLGLLDLVKSDLARFTQTFALRGQDYSGLKVAFESFLFKAGFQAVFLYRLSHWLWQKGWIYAAWAVARSNLFLTGAEIEFNAKIGPGFFIAHPVGIVIGRGCSIGAGATIFQGVCLTVKSWRPEDIRQFPKIGDDCHIFANAMIMGGVQIGNKCVIGAQSLVTRDMPGGSMAVGSPADIAPEKGRELIESWSPKGREAGSGE